MMRTTAADIKVYESPVSDKVIATFSTIEALCEYGEVNSISADCVAVNNHILLGWDEVYRFV